MSNNGANVGQTSTVSMFKTGWKPGRRKNLKSVLQDELKLSQTAPLGTPTFYGLDAPPSLECLRKYCDVTGLPAKYTSPEQMRYYNAEVYEIVRDMPGTVSAAHKRLRMPTQIV